MNAKKFSDAISELDGRYIDEAVSYGKKAGNLYTKGTSENQAGKWYFKKKVGTAGLMRVAMVLLLLIVFLTGYFIVISRKSPIPLSENSTNVTVKYTSNPFILPGSAGSLVRMTEEELFTEFDTAIFKGTVSEISNIVVSFNGEKEYRAIAQIRVEKVYRGTCSEGDTVSVMLPCPVSTIIRSTGSTTLSAMKEGVTGIFMPMVFDDESALWMENGASLDKRDLAAYGFADGERYAFLETAKGLVFDRETYGSIADAVSLDEVEKYIESMLK